MPYYRVEAAYTPLGRSGWVANSANPAPSPHIFESGHPINNVSALVPSGRGGTTRGIRCAAGDTLLLNMWLGTAHEVKVGTTWFYGQQNRTARFEVVAILECLMHPELPDYESAPEGHGWFICDF